MSVSSTETAAPWELLEELAERGDAGKLRAETESLGARECARAISRMSPGLQGKVLATLDVDYAAELISDMHDAQAARVVENLPVENAAAILAEMDSNQRADLLGELNGTQREILIDLMAPAAAADANRLTKYPSNVAGGLMITEYLAYPLSYTVRQVVDDMRTHSEEYSRYSVQYTYVVSDEGELVGVLSLRDLLLTPGGTPIAHTMIPRPTSVTDLMPLDELAELFEEKGYLGFPVTDGEGRLCGLVRREDVMEALGARAESDFLKTQGIVGGEELRSMPLLTRSGRRLSWLSINIVLNLISASIIGVFTGTLEQVIALAVFLPIISDMSGCSGNQAVAVSMRELTLGLLKPHEVVYVWMKESSLGVINGIALGLIVAGVAWLAPFGLWEGGPMLGLVVGVALAVNTVVAVLFGGSVPLILKAFKADPALASGPILTTVTDMCGFLLVLGLATLFLPYLT